MTGLYLAISFTVSRKLPSFCESKSSRRPVAPVWAHTIYLSNLGELWNFRDQTNKDLNARKCWKVWKQINNHFLIEITCNRSNIILNQFLNKSNMIWETCHHFSASCKSISLTGNSRLFFSLSPTFTTRTVDWKGPSLFRYLSGPALTNSTLISWFISSGQLATSFGKIVITSFPDSAAYALVVTWFLIWPGVVSSQLPVLIHWCQHC